MAANPMLGLRVDAELRAKLELRAAQVGYERGHPVSVSDLVRETLEREAELALERSAGEHRARLERLRAERRERSSA